MKTGIKFVIQICLIIVFMWAFIYLGVNKFLSFIISLLIISLPGLIKDRELFKETISTIIHSIGATKKYANLLNNYRREGEIPNFSPEISVDNKRYLVIRYGKRFSPRYPPTGFVIINKENKNINEQTIIRVKNLYLLWEDIYFNTIFSEKLEVGNINPKELLFKDKSKDMIPSNLKKFERLYKDEEFSFRIAKKRIESEKNYERECKKEIIPLLKKLDGLTIEQHENLTEYFTKIIKIFRVIIKLFKEPSDKLYNQFISEGEKLKELIIKIEADNLITQRINLWAKIEEARKKKEVKISIFWGIMIDIYQFINNSSVPFSTLISLILNKMINLGIKGYNFINMNYISYNKFGIKSVEIARMMKKGIVKSLKRYTSILENNSINEIRNMKEIISN